MAPRFGGYLSQPHLWGSCLQPSPRCRGADQDVPAPRIFTGTSNSAHPKPNSPPASAGSPGLWGGKSPSSELGGPIYKHSLWDLTKAALGGCKNVRGNNDKCPGGRWTHSRLLRSGAALSTPHTTRGQKGSVFLAFDQSVPTHIFLTPVCIQVTAHSQASCLVTAQCPSGRLQPLPALQLFRVTQLSLFWGALFVCHLHPAGVGAAGVGQERPSQTTCGSQAGSPLPCLPICETGCCSLTCD